MFHYRGIIGFIAFVVVYLYSYPNTTSYLGSLPLIILGLGLRFWAAGYLGEAGRSPVITAQGIVRSGPYRFIRHPLYLGNLFLVAGVLFLLRPPVGFFFAIGSGFMIEYYLIARVEEQFLNDSELPLLKPVFEWRRAMVEKWTWLVVSLIYLMGLAKALCFCRR